ncbi:uncharacterized protein ARMOST_18514 [Armillaria ostoyae]|uniref:Uncharacterized protein n=1 Tax=Armillaria ostoyae TaxID=47428 RepID=A0A284S205_ARMOS|nr:uncharacterized protein ARMOST_18514 [Armillaria ostoyae]
MCLHLGTKRLNHAVLPCYVARTGRYSDALMAGRCHRKRKKSTIFVEVLLDYTCPFPKIRIPFIPRALMRRFRNCFAGLEGLVGRIVTCCELSELCRSIDCMAISFV